MTSKQRWMTLILWQEKHTIVALVIDCSHTLMSGIQHKLVEMKRPRTETFPMQLHLSTYQITSIRLSSIIPMWSELIFWRRNICSLCNKIIQNTIIKFTKPTKSRTKFTEDMATKLRSSNQITTLSSSVQHMFNLTRLSSGNCIWDYCIGKQAFGRISHILAKNHNSSLQRSSWFAMVTASRQWT